MLRRTRLAWALTLAVLVQVAVSIPAQAQARDTVANLRTRYNTAKTNAKAEGDLKKKFDSIDADLARAARLGRTGELRRLYTQGITLAAGRQWTPELEFTTSLALRTDRVFVDPSEPIEFRLEQIYAPSIELTEPLSVRVTLNKPAAGGGGGQIGDKLRDVETLNGVPRDLIDNPLRFDVDFSGIPDGRTVVRLEVSEGKHALGAVTLAMDVRHGLDERLQRIRSDIGEVKGFDALHAEVLYPASYIQSVNLGRITIGQFDVEKELAAAESVLATLKAGRDPFAGKTGDMKRHYFLEEADEVMPYRVYVPSSYKSERAYPLIIALHGNGLTENYFFDNANGELPRLAEERGYIVAAPLGYRIDGGYGNNNGSRPAEELRKLELSEKDVMHVLDLMKQNYRIDPNRIYLIGHSMGGSGSWYLGARYPQIWAALAPFAGGGVPETMSQMKQIPQFVVHGDADATAPVERSRAMVAEMKRLGVEHQYTEVPGGTHGGV